jgi:hypothetical protein
MRQRRINGTQEPRHIMLAHVAILSDSHPWSRAGSRLVARRMPRRGQALSLRVRVGERERSLLFAFVDDLAERPGDSRLHR